MHPTCKRHVRDPAYASNVWPPYCNDSLPSSHSLYAQTLGVNPVSGHW